VSHRQAGEGDAHRFGGEWTAAKLGVLGKYLKSYTTALQRQAFWKWYIDGFAGSGSISPASEAPTEDTSGSLFSSDAHPETLAILDGSASIAMRTEPRFDHFVFIERDPARCKQLDLRRAELNIPKQNVQIHQGDINEIVDDLRSIDWRLRRAVMFLDPYGLQVEWQTLEAIAATRAIDLWVLFPLMGATRMLKKTGDIPEAWSNRLDRLLGTHDWHNRLYTKRTSPGLFGDEDLLVRSGAEVIGRVFVEQLQTIFPGVATQPGILRNSTNSPLFLLCFAASNENGKDLALRIANHLLKDLR
jgi:three-Cys-motif partner protein